VPDYLAEALAPADVALAGGVSFRDGASHNALFHWNGARLREVYRKRALVPVNEWHYERGRALPPLALRGTALGLGICLDSVFGALARQAVRAGAEVLVYVTEDSFAGRTVTPEMHLRVTAFRAAETARPAVFASQSGPSAVFDARGRVVQRLPHGEAAGAVVAIRPATAVTPFVRFGNLAGWASLAAAVLAAAAAARPRRARRSATGATASGDGG
jgi:apolipoprotein N-acyltransferase